MKVCEISHFFCYLSYRQKAVATAQLIGEKELIISPVGWTEDYHGTGIEHGDSDKYILRERRAYLNWTIWGGKRFQLFVLSPRIIQDMREYNPDIIVVDSEPFGLLAFEVALIKKLFFPHSKLIVYSSQNIYKRYPFPFSVTEVFVMRQATLLFARTEEIKQVLLNKGCKKPIYIIPHGVDVKRFSPASSVNHHISSSDGPFNVGYVGSLGKHKGVHLLVEAVANCRNPINLTIVGDGPEQRALMAQAANLPNIHFQNSIPNKQLPEVLRQLDVLVLPSITMPNWKEQFGRIIVEAMACGVPVVGSTCGSIPEVIGDGGLVFTEGSVIELAKVLESLAVNRNLLKQLSIKARQRVLDHFSWETVSQKIFDIFEAI